MTDTQFTNWIIDEGKAAFEWYNNKPQVIKDLVRAYPYCFEYIIKENAPYSISAPGTIVNIESYREDETVRVSFPTNKLTESAKLHLIELCTKHNKPFPADNIIQVVIIEPKYLLKIEK